MTLTQPDIINVLNTARPVSIVRAGDGEKIVLESNNSIESYQLCIQAVMKRQMGYEPTMSEVEAIRQNLISAYQSADIIGLPMQKNLADLNKHWKGVADTVKPYATTNKTCSIDVFYDMLYDGSLFDWIKEKPVVNYISCRKIPFERLHVKQVNHFQIAPEVKFTSYTGERHYPDQFNRIERWMDKCAVEGHVCLVGAGVIGKIYCNWFRDRGGIALDLGAVFDLMAGFATRGPLRGLDVKNETYKL